MYQGTGACKQVMFVTVQCKEYVQGPLSPCCREEESRRVGQFLGLSSFRLKNNASSEEQGRPRAQENTRKQENSMYECHF